MKFLSCLLFAGALLAGCTRQPAAQLPPDANAASGTGNIRNDQAPVGEEQNPNEILMAKIKIGTSHDDVVKLLGKPAGTNLDRDFDTTYIYMFHYMPKANGPFTGGFTVTFHDGKVIRVERIPSTEHRF